MKTLAVLLALTLSSTSFAADKKSWFGGNTAPVAAPASSGGGGGESYSGGNNRWGVGFSTISLANQGTSATAVKEFSSRSTMQLFMGIPDSDPFIIYGGGSYKYDVSNNRNAGFHLGGGFLVGNASANAANPANNVGSTSFSFSVAAIAGFHFNFPGLNNVAFHIDGGPTFTHVGGVGTGGKATNSFSMSAMSSLLGLSALYMF